MQSGAPKSEVYALIQELPLGLQDVVSRLVQKVYDTQESGNKRFIDIPPVSVKQPSTMNSELEDLLPVSYEDDGGVFEYQEKLSELIQNIKTTDDLVQLKEYISEHPSLMKTLADPLFGEVNIDEAFHFVDDVLSGIYLDYPNLSEYTGEALMAIYEEKYDQTVTEAFGFRAAMVKFLDENVYNDSHVIGQLELKKTELALSNAQTLSEISVVLQSAESAVKAGYLEITEADCARTINDLQRITIILESIRDGSKRGGISFERGSDIIEDIIRGSESSRESGLLNAHGIRSHIESIVQSELRAIRDGIHQEVGEIVDQLPEEVVQESKETGVPTQPELSPVEHAFLSKFQISPEELHGIPGYEKLSTGQRKMVYENFAQLVLGDIHDETDRLCAILRDQKTVSMVQTMQGVAGKVLHGSEYERELATKVGMTLGSALAGLREVFVGAKTKINIEKSVYAQFQRNDTEAHMAALAQLGQLVESVSLYGPGVHETEGGELLPDLVQLKHRERTKEEWSAIRELNAAAHTLAKIPDFWKGNTLGVDTESEWKITALFREKILGSKDRKQKHIYNQAYTDFVNKKVNLERVLKESGKSESEIALLFDALESRVSGLQALQTNPNAVAELGEISDKIFWKETAKNIMKGNIPYFALGFASRTVANAGFAALGAPLFAGSSIVSALLAAGTSRNRTAIELQERDKKARKGIRDTEEGALNVVSAGHTVQRLQSLWSDYKNADVTKKDVFARKLVARLSYIRERQLLNRVDYGPAISRITVRNELDKALSEVAGKLIVDTQSQYFQKLKERMSRLDSAAKEGIIKARDDMREGDLKWSVGKALGASILGSLTAQYAQNGLEPRTVPSGPVSAPVLEEPPQVATAPSGPKLEVTNITPVSDTRAVIETQGSGIEVSTGSVEVDTSKLVTETALPQVANAPEPIPEGRTGKLDIEVAPATLPSVPDVVVVKGDTLFDVLRKHYPGVQGLPQNEQNRVLKLLIDRLSLRQLFEMGVKTGNSNLIFPGDKISIDKFTEFTNTPNERIPEAPSTVGRSRPGFRP
jgi:polyhydroxyalkanoate synthesis regulator phasin